MYAFHTFKDKANGFRWRLVAENGRIVADSAESYTREQDVWRAIASVAENIPSEPIVQKDKNGRRKK